VKKIVREILLLAVLASGSFVLSAKIFSIDSMRLLKESREGQKVVSENEKDRKGVMDFEYEKSKKIAKLRDKVENGMRREKWGEEEIRDKYEELGRAQREAKFKVEASRQDFERRASKRVQAFKKKAYSVAENALKKQDCTVLLDKKNTSGLIFVSPSTDKTDTVIKELNAKYKKEKATIMLTKSSKTQKDKTNKA
jgi:Skp family chaperone for outer membrane proteins